MPTADARMRRGFCRTPHGQLHVRTCGEGDRTLVMLQILPIGIDMLAGVMPLLARSGLRCVAIDLLGYGHSDRRPASWLVGDFADNLQAGLADLDVDPDYLLAGHFAGMVAAELAIRHPARIGKLVLDGTPLWPAAYRANIQAEMGLKPVAMTEDGAYLSYFWAMAWGMLRKLSPDISITPDTVPAIHATLLGFLKTAFQPDVTSAMAAHDMATRIADLTVPTLVIGSDNDTQIEFFDQHLRANRHAVGHRFAGTHPLHDMARPDRAGEYAAVVSSFLAEDARSGG